MTEQHILDMITPERPFTRTGPGQQRIRVQAERMGSEFSSAFIEPELDIARHVMDLTRALAALDIVRDLKTVETGATATSLAAQMAMEREALGVAARVRQQTERTLSR